ncbi:CobW family GTP-binding protein [Paracoccus shandongensis]|uniref:CobW family GTP-binding protein n=1 Tax=Paracoccus shandongensis TaxID=2816048 RepID=UPI001A8DB064|nr:CobW family GTP-binding protein [Paracoccus shandongensis]
MAEPRSDGRLPLTILGGFLGAGKSTWLRHQLHDGRFVRHHVLVNEAAETPVDNLLLAGVGRITVLAGGCACCTGLPALLAALRGICDEASGRDAGRVAGILLETSGLADPGRIAAAIAGDPVLTRRLAVAQVLVLVDSLHGASQLTTEPLARAQIEAADALVLTKPVQADPETLARLALTLRQINPAAALSAAEQGVPGPLPPQDGLRPLDLPPLAAREPILPHRLEVGNGGWVALSTWLSALIQARGDDIVRIKGVVRTPAGRLLLQSVRRVVQPPEILPDDNTALAGPPPEEGVIVLIGRFMDADRLARSWRRFGA